MQIQNYNSGWRVKKIGGSAMTAMFDGGEWRDVTLPCDEMILEERSPEAPARGQSGFYPGGQYVYAKSFSVPEEWENMRAELEFEGIYQKALVYVNGTLAAVNPLGYSGFVVPLNEHLLYGEDNTIKVIADNSAQPNSRWYTGSGIYRDVNLFLGGPVHIQRDGVRVRTEAADPEVASVGVEVQVCSLLRHRSSTVVTIELKDSEGNEEAAEGSPEGGIEAVCRIPVTLFPQSEEAVRCSLPVRHPKLWSCDHPYLYDVVIRVEADQEAEIGITENGNPESGAGVGSVTVDQVTLKCGIRTVKLDAVSGLRISGETVKLRGACIHHDNGILGAATHRDAERRRCRLLKEAGFNSIRCAHNPVSKAMLEACDEYGILVMDELSDIWTYRKNFHDETEVFPALWREEVRRMVEKDRNHPSVILYSTGNEILEVGSASGARFGRAISNLFHELDPDRYTTCGVNGMMATASAGNMQEIFSDILEEEAPVQRDGMDQDVGTVNLSLSMMAGERGDRFAAHELTTRSLEEISMGLDVIGLNYLTGRHVLENSLHPTKTVVGTETYPADIARLWEIVKENAHVLGDFTWAGYDYLGEAGCGIFHYGGERNFSDIYPERAAYIGDINLIGERRPISYYREVIYGLRHEPYLAVDRMDHEGQIPAKTAWMFRDNIASWTWPGQEGVTAHVEVYSDAEEVELLLLPEEGSEPETISYGRKRVGAEHPCTAVFEIPYQAGQLTAITYTDGIESGRCCLQTAGETCQLKTSVESDTLHAGSGELAFLTARLCDSKGIRNYYETKKVTISVEGSGELLSFGSAAPAGLSQYSDLTWETFEGAVMAVIRAGKQPGEIRVRFSAEGCEEVVVVLKCE